MRIVAKLFLIPLLLFAGTDGWAQGLSSLLGNASTTATAAPPTASTDPYHRETPRSSVYAFLEACHSEEYTKAWHYLDLQKLNSDEREQDGPELAQGLEAILDHNSQFDLANLSDRPEGHRQDSLPVGTDELATFQLKGQPVTLYLQRITRNNAQIWVVSADSVGKIPQLKLALGESAIEKILPTPLVSIKLLGTSLWVWIALILLAFLLLFLSKLLSKAVLSLIAPLAQRYAKDLTPVRLAVFAEPLRLLLAIAVFRACIEAFTPSALLRLYVGYLLTLLFFLGTASLLMRTVDAISDHVRSRLDARQRAMSYSILPLFVRIIKIGIFCLAILATLAEWGYNTNAILAGLGVGGLAVALAAQKTIENLFGSIAVITDRPVLVGDFFNYGGNVGTVEDIGLRSTRIRTLDRTVVTIPNSVFSTMTLENYSRRDRMWFHPTLSLRRGTTPEEIQKVMDAITKILEDHPMVDPTDVPVRFTKITLQSLDLEIFAYVVTPDFNVFLRVQTELLLKFMHAVADAGSGFAVPLQESVVTESDGNARFFRVLSPQDSESDGAEPQHPESHLHPTEH